MDSTTKRLLVQEVFTSKTNLTILAKNGEAAMTVLVTECEDMLLRGGTDREVALKVITLILDLALVDERAAARLQWMKLR